MFRIRIGDVLERLAEMEPESFDGCLTDPPYGLGFMGKHWDHGVPDRQVWAEVLRVLKPGAMLLAFGGTRTHHRLMCAIEDAGFEIRDCCMWLYGSGFPKSMDISKAIDKAAGAERQVVGSNPCARPNHDGKRIWIGDRPGKEQSHPPLTAPATTEAAQWSGYGTALKPAWEPIIVAMKPLDGTFAGNALKHGVAGINVDGSRIPSGERDLVQSDRRLATNTYGTGLGGSRNVGTTDTGRWPANVILDEEAGAALDEQTGTLTSGTLSPANNVRQSTGWSGGSKADNEGGASRFFYCAKASRSDRGSGNDHPTVKPRRLCAYLATLILPPSNRRLLVPYSGSGSEMLGALDAGWNTVIGIEKEQKYIDIARSRLA